MNLKRTLLDCMEAEQLKALCTELSLPAYQRSTDAMHEALRSSRGAKPEKLISKLKVAQLRAVLEEHGVPTGGSKQEVVGIPWPPQK